MWQKFDKDKSGALDRKEVAELVSERPDHRKSDVDMHP